MLLFIRVLLHHYKLGKYLKIITCIDTSRQNEIFQRKCITTKIKIIKQDFQKYNIINGLDADYIIGKNF